MQREIAKIASKFIEITFGLLFKQWSWCSPKNPHVIDMYFTWESERRLGLCFCVAKYILCWIGLSFVVIVSVVQYSVSHIQPFILFYCDKFRRFANLLSAKVYHTCTRSYYTEMIAMTAVSIYQLQMNFTGKFIIVRVLQH